VGTTHPAGPVLGLGGGTAIAPPPLPPKVLCLWRCRCCRTRCRCFTAKLSALRGVFGLSGLPGPCGARYAFTVVGASGHVDMVWLTGQSDVVGGDPSMHSMRASYRAAHRLAQSTPPTSTAAAAAPQSPEGLGQAPALQSMAGPPLSSVPPTATDGGADPAKTVSRAAEIGVATGMAAAAAAAVDMAANPAKAMASASLQGADDKSVVVTGAAEAGAHHWNKDPLFCCRTGTQCPILHDK
jgi:hypothetical protein